MSVRETTTEVRAVSLVICSHTHKQCGKQADTHTHTYQAWPENQAEVSSEQTVAACWSAWTGRWPPTRWVTWRQRNACQQFPSTVIDFVGILICWQQQHGDYSMSSYWTISKNVGVKRGQCYFPIIYFIFLIALFWLSVLKMSHRIYFYSKRWESRRISEEPLAGIH